jgi:hypothetical protein
MLNYAFTLYFYYFEVFTNLVAVFAVSVVVVVAAIIGAVVAAVVAVVVSEQEVTAVAVARIQPVETVMLTKLVFLLLKQPH